MDYIDELLFKRREKIKELIRNKKTGKKLAEALKIPYERLQAYKENLKNDMNLSTEEEEIYSNYDEFKFRTSDQAMNPHKYKNRKPANMPSIPLAKTQTRIDEAIQRITHRMKKADDGGAEKEPPKLSINEKLFVHHYLVTNNVSEASKRAGYAHHKEGFRLLKKPEIQEAITIELGNSIKQSGVTVKSIVEDINLIKERCLQGHPVVDQDGLYLGEWKADHTTALKALELLGKHLKMFNDRIEHTGADGGPIKVVVEPEFDYSALTTEELKEFLRLRQKLKVKPQKTVEAEYKTL